MMMFSARQLQELKYYFDNECVEYARDDRKFSDLTRGDLEELWDFFQEDYPDGIDGEV
jgi:hypothetical protein